MAKGLDQDHYYMQLALDLAAKAQGRTSPNPMVGAVVVQQDQVVGQGYHARAGAPHAEVGALEQAGAMAQEATLYVTLEPCCHHGRTPPCTQAIMQAGIKRLVVAMTDPNPLVAGQGLRILQQAGVEVTQGVMAAEARRLNEVFIKYITTGLPLVVLKTATSLDGKIATASGQSQWITGPAAREQVHRLRDRYDAILVGVGTVLADNPSLTTRLPAGGGQDPIRIILDSQAKTPADAQILALTRTSAAPTIIVTTAAAPAAKIRQLKEQGAQVLQVPAAKKGVDIAALMKKLSQRGITSVFVEGGAMVNGSFIEQNMVDKIYWFMAPKIIGGAQAPGAVGGAGILSLQEVPRLKNMIIHHYGEDICIQGDLIKRGD